MLYNPKWEVQTKTDPFSLESLIAWLEKMPPAESYNWEDCKGGCLIGLYGAAMGLGLKWHGFHSKLFVNGKLDIASNQPWTFGAALARARKAVA